MKSATLAETFKAIDRIENQVRTKDAWRLDYHLMPPTGWMNDPNGLCQFKGVYHVFYQYAPFDANGDNKMWGHYTTRDWIHWTKEKVAVFPDTPYDQDGAYSGSALIDEGKMYLYYTGNVKHSGRYDYIYVGRAHNVLMVYSEDGVHFSEKQLLMENKDYPSTCSCHVRDPKVWRENGLYHMILGARTNGDTGEALVYTSSDKLNWQLLKVLRSKEKLGYMWECPDIFQIEGQQVLIVCPQGVSASGDRYQNVYQCGYFLPEKDILAHDLPLDDFEELDGGFDFYAPQTFEDDKGRRILIAWMGLPDATYSNPTVAYDWQHALTVPRELTLLNGVLCQNPIEEMLNLRGPAVTGSFEETLRLSTCFDAVIEFDAMGAGFQMTLRQDVVLTYDVRAGRLALALGDSGYGRTVRRVSVEKLERLRILSDRSSIEIFINNGEKTMTTRVYDAPLTAYSLAVKPLAADDLKSKCLRGSFTCYEMNSFHITPPVPAIKKEKEHDESAL